MAVGRGDHADEIGPPGRSHRAMSPPSRHRSRAERLVLAAPYLWLVAFFLIPFAIVFKISLSQTAIAQPPYVPVLELAAGWRGLRDFFSDLSPANYLTLVGDELYFVSYLKSLKVAAISTLILVLAGYPLAYAMTRSPRAVRSLLVVLVMLPFWTSFLVRVYAWMAILQHDGLLNQALVWLRIVDMPTTWLATDTAIYLGIVYSYLPFMVLPLYASLEKIDDSLLEAAADLGCPRWKTFLLVTIPLSLPGLAAGALLCFIPIVGEFVIPDLLGGSETPMIGQTLWSEFFANKDWPVASAVAVVLVLVLVAPIALYQHVQARDLER
jgi:putrescine transport system permease protein